MKATKNVDRTFPNRATLYRTTTTGGRYMPATYATTVGMPMFAVFADGDIEIPMYSEDGEAVKVRLSSDLVKQMFKSTEALRAAGVYDDEA